MPILRTHIVSALDELIALEAGTSFQALAVALTKQKWPDLIATEWHKDGGLDAYAPASLADDRKAKGVASSITGTLDKVKSDAKRAKENYQDLEILIFVTPHKITASAGRAWAAQIRGECGLELHVIPREDIITSLMLPSNASLCGTLPGISVPVEQDDAELTARVAEAVADENEIWRTRQRAANRPVISLNAVRLDGAGKETSNTLDISALRVALTESRRIALEAPGGGGKTTTLVQLATESPRDGEVMFLIDLPAWIRQRTNILEFIARAPPFLARSITARDLARLAQRKHFSFLLNGWNEIAEINSDDAVIALLELERSFPTAGIVVATRTHYISPPLPGAFRAKLLPFTRTQRASYLRQTLGDQNDDLRVKLESNDVLDDLTRTPLILAEVVTIFESGNPIPSTRIGVLGAVVKLMEATPQHRSHLQSAPLYNRADHFLTDLAAQMTARSEVVMLEEDARCAIRSSTPDAVLQALSAHHVLERVDHPSPTFRFQHQQFQEFYAARRLSDALTELVHHGEAPESKAFAESYINMPMWEEPLRMVAEEIRVLSEDATTKDAAINLGSHLVGLALSVDPILASDLSRLSGPAVWEVVRSSVGKVLRDWYAVGDSGHRRLALAAMLSTGSDDFADILMPMLSHTDKQVRYSVYAAASVFYPTSLGPHWRCVVKSWNEDARTDFVGEVTHRGMIDIGESFATNDPSPKVRKRAIQELSWISAGDALTRIVNALNDADLAAALGGFIPDNCPEALRPRFVAANRRLVTGELTPIARMNRLFRGIKLGDAAIGTNLIGELDSLNLLSAPLDQHARHTIGEALKIVKMHDPAWVSTWVTTKLLDDTLRGDQWQSFLLPASQGQADDLINRLATEELKYMEASAARLILSASATPALVAQVFAKIYELQRALSKGDRRPSVMEGMRQLCDVLRAVPAETTVTGIMQNLSEEFDADKFDAAVDVFGTLNTDEEELRSVLSEPLREALRGFVKQGIERLLAEDLYDDWTRAQVAIVLGRVGDQGDVADLRRLITADIESQKTKRTGMIHANWYVRALMLLDVDGADSTLIELLWEENYLREAVSALRQLAVMPNADKSLLRKATDFEAIWAARRGVRCIDFHAERATRYAQAVTQRIENLKQDGEHATTPEYYKILIEDLAVVLAALDGRDSANFVIDALTLPGRLHGHARKNGIRELLISGATLSLDSMLTVLGPVIEEAKKMRASEDGLLFDCLELLPFSDDPARAIAHIEKAIGTLRYWTHQYRGLMTAMGHTRSEAAVSFLLNLARAPQGLGDADDAWIEAMGCLDVRAARNVLLSFIDPQLPAAGVNIRFDFRGRNIFAARVGAWSRKDPALRQRLIALSSGQLTPIQRELLVAIYGELGSDETLLLAANLLQGNLDPYGSERGFEAQFLERRPYGHPGSFELVPHDATRARAELFKMMLTDPIRRTAAFTILGQVEVWRLEHGRPHREPRHPMIESGMPWPPPSLMN